MSSSCAVFQQPNWPCSYSHRHVRVLACKNARLISAFFQFVRRGRLCSLLSFKHMLRGRQRAQRIIILHHDLCTYTLSTCYSHNEEGEFQANYTYLVTFCAIFTPAVATAIIAKSTLFSCKCHSFREPYWVFQKYTQICTFDTRSTMRNTLVQSIMYIIEQFRWT